jgi:hypothetical protein
MQTISRDTYPRTVIENIRRDFQLARFEALAATFAVRDNDPERARNHAKWSARLALRAIHTVEAIA